MSIVVNLSAELEKTIAAEAAKAGITVSDYVAGRLAQGTTTNGSHGSKLEGTRADRLPDRHHRSRGPLPPSP
jgi:hypothetical protein